MAQFINIQNGDNGVGIRVKLNSLGSDDEISFRIVSEYAEIENEIRFFKTGSIVFCVAEGKWYRYSGLAWVENFDLPTQNYVVSSEINFTDSPYNITIEQICFADTTTNDIIINLPPSNSNLDLKYIIKNIGSGIVYIDGDALDVVDGDSIFELYEDESIEIVSYNGGWHII